MAQASSSELIALVQNAQDEVAKLVKAEPQGLPLHARQRRQTGTLSRSSSSRWKMR